MPEDGRTVTEGTPIGFAGTASDAEDGSLSSSIEWRSSRDGSLGTGASVTATLSVGTHTVTASVTDAEGASASSSVTVQVLEDEPPEVEVTAPEDGTTVAEGTSITFTAAASDGEDGNVTGSIAWTSDRDGALGTGGSVAATLSAGSHTVTARVTDSQGQSAEDAVRVTVEPDAPPQVQIVEPESGTTVTEGGSLEFSGSASDAEDGDLSESIQWTSDRDGSLGSGPGVEATLSVGTHTVSAVVTDSFGQTGEDEITVTVEPTGEPPAGRFEVTASGAVSGTFEGPAVHARSGIALLADAPLGTIRLHRREIPEGPGTYPVRHVLDVLSGEAGPDSFWGTVAGDENRLVSGGSVELTSVSPDEAEGTLVLQAETGSGQSPITLEGSFEAAAAETPTFTPFTVAPDLANGSELQELMGLYSARIPVAGSFTAQVWLHVDAEGTVVNTLVNESSGWPRVDFAALAVADAARFTPARNGDDVVPVWISLPFTFEVTDGLAVSVTSPATNSSFTSGTTVTFTGTASDPEDGDLSASIVWSSDLSGQLGTGSSVQSTLSSGTHTITATVADSDGNTATDSIIVTISRR
jgi:TonB family protein